MWRFVGHLVDKYDRIHRHTTRRLKCWMWNFWWFCHWLVYCLDVRYSVSLKYIDTFTTTEHTPPWTLDLRKNFNDEKSLAFCCSVCYNGRSCWVSDPRKGPRSSYPCVLYLDGRIHSLPTISAAAAIVLHLETVWSKDTTTRKKNQTERLAIILLRL